MRVAAAIALSKEQSKRLEKWASTRSTSVRLRERARIVLMAAQGMTNKAIAAQLGVDANKVGRWRSRVAKEGVGSIEKERPRGANHGGKHSDKQAQLRSQVIEATTPNDATHWSCRSMARHLNTTHSFVHRVWRAHGLKPHLIRTFFDGVAPAHETAFPTDATGNRPRSGSRNVHIGEKVETLPNQSPGVLSLACDDGQRMCH